MSSRGTVGEFQELRIYQVLGQTWGYGEMWKLEKVKGHLGVGLLWDDAYK